ncbi:GMC family oxidoreductase [uncultured Sphingomonas sp.]|uniref:GMC oxidoreductase n=1 Tax=uncultured Sphingomonas sp. TaxID=158754 RepID=UPI0025E0B51C|nr:GMC family oxidoreductase [uncultured Sphingomonas sp.]
MRADASELTTPPAPADVCIVGTGAAGLTLAARCAALGLDVLVLEAGGGRVDPATQDAYVGDVVDPRVHWPLDTFRVRALGGTTALWGGRAIPFDPIDFEARPWIAHSGWPIGYDEVARYYPAAMEAAEAGAFDHVPSGPIVPGLDGEWLHTTIERFSRPTNFWTRYGKELTAARNVRVITRAPVTAIRLAPEGDRVDHLEVRLASGATWRIQARTYVLAAGGLETTRLLLAADDVVPHGPGNLGGWLGRGYMCHLAAHVGVAQFTGDPRAIGFDYERDAEGIYIRRRLSPTPAAQRECHLLNSSVRLHIPDPNDPAHGDPVLSLMYLAAYAVKYEYSRASREADRSIGPYLRHIGNLARHPLQLFHFVRTWGVKRYLSSRRIPSIALPSRDNRYPLEFISEQSPNWDSRVALSSDRDALGMRRLRVDWRVASADFDSARATYRLIRDELARTGAGTLDYDEDALEQVLLDSGAYGGHHSGTTRMADHVRDGVVDRDCQVHGVAGLYVASAAVTPTSSQANPTLTAIALALRLADHLKERAT